MRGKIAPYRAISSYPLPLGFNGRWAVVYRWFSGRPMNGHRYTNATGFRYGTAALDPSRRASSYHLLPGALRFAYFRAPIMLVAPYVLSWLIWPLATYLTTIALGVVAVWRVQRWLARRTHRRHVIEPVAAVASAVLKEARVRGRGHAWVSVPEGFRDTPEAKVSIRLPDGWVAADGDRTALVKAVATRLAVDELVATWQLAGAKPSVQLAMPPAPPPFISLAMAMEDADKVEDTEVMVGYGPRGRVEVFSLAQESPHGLINGGSGAGKSVLLAFLVSQFMRRGYGVLVLDAKFVSHMWLRRVPGVHYASEAEEMHEALVWLDGELLRRARLVSSSADVDAAARRLVPLVAVLEEMNGATSRLRAYWKSIKGPDDPALSPALAALANIANMGRELRVHILMAGQSITARSTGGPEGRESFGGRFLARATGNAWRMLAPQIKPAPVKRRAPGRWHLVVGDLLKDFQVPFVDLKNERSVDAVAELIEWATGGRPVPDVAAMIAGWGEEEVAEVETPSSETSSPDVISLSGYAQEARVDLAWLRRQVERRPEAPAPAGRGERGAGLYDRAALDQFVTDRLKTAAAE